MAVEQIRIDQLKEKINGPGLTVVDFYADWCGPCKQLGPILDEIANEQLVGVSIHKVDVDIEQEFATKYGIRSIPTVFFFKNGEVVDQFVGVKDKSSIIEMIEAKK